MPTETKDPDETKRFRVNWTARLSPSGATLSSVAWSATPSGLTLSGPTNTTLVATTLVAGGVLGTTYQLLCRATTSDSQVLDHTVTILVQSA